MKTINYFLGMLRAILAVLAIMILATSLNLAHAKAKSNKSSNKYKEFKGSFSGNCGANAIGSDDYLYYEIQISVNKNGSISGLADLDGQVVNITGKLNKKEKPSVSYGASGSFAIEGGGTVQIYMIYTNLKGLPPSAKLQIQGSTIVQGNFIGNCALIRYK